MNQTVSRRTFLATTAGACAIPHLGSVAVCDESDKKVSQNDRINIGFIGVGTMGRGHLGSFLSMPDVVVVGVCDVVKERREDAKGRVEKTYANKRKGTYKGCAEYSDFRKLLDQPGLDAVVIATPDHWHAITCILATRAKKDIYCEKPLTHNIAEGRRIVNEVAKAKTIFQTGSQQRSEFNNYFRRAVELVRNGVIGKLKTIRIGVGAPNRPCDLPTQEIPVGTDWDTWLGPAPERGYNEILCPKGIHKHFPAWRNYREFAGGGLADMGAHHFDIAQWALDMDRSGPVEVIPPSDPKKFSGLKFVYANGVEMFHGGEADCVFVGDKGTIFASRGYLRTDPADLAKVVLDNANGFHAYPSNNHRRNWIECLRSRASTICPAETGHRSATICHLANIGYQLRRTLRWNPALEQFVDDKEANALTTREPREKWKI